MTIYSLDILLFLFGTSLLFHVQFYLLLPDLHIDFSRGRSGDLVFPSLSEFPQFIVIHVFKGFGIVNETEIDVFLELSCFFDDPADIGNLISGSSAFSKTSLNIWKFTMLWMLSDKYYGCYVTYVMDVIWNAILSDIVSWYNPEYLCFRYHLCSILSILASFCSSIFGFHNSVIFENTEWDTNNDYLIFNF